MFWNLVAGLVRFLFSLRYRIEVKGLERLRDLKGGMLFLPNHPALIDPLFLFFYFWNDFKMRPLTVEYIYRQPVARFWMKLIRAIPIPNFDTSVNQLKIKRGEIAMDEVIRGLHAGDSFIIYPAGRLKSSGNEVVAGSSGAHQLIQKFPEVNVVLIRTTGLWGSSFSRAIKGVSPDLIDVFIQGAKVLLQNFLFFAPRRRVVIELEPSPKDFPRKSTRVEFNRYLENWYNQYPMENGSRVKLEPLSLISYKFWKKDVPIPFDFSRPQAVIADGHISAQTKDQIYAEIREILNEPNIEIREEMHLEADLGFDSLNIADLITFVTRHWEVAELHPSDIDTVQSVLEIAEGLRKIEISSKEPKTHGWKEEKGRLDPLLPRGKTLAEAFLFCADRMKGFQACGDDVTGVISYSQFKTRALVLANYFKENCPEERIGVMLPASNGAMLTIFALEFAGKVPVMMNWTLGPRFIDDMIEMSGVQRIVSSWKFLEKLSHVEFGSAIDRFELLEEIREKLSLKQKLLGKIQSYMSAKTLVRQLMLDKIDEDAAAVILFTSGTEAKPKGVPLSHRNVLSDLRSGTQCIEIRPSDVIYGFLPPFHSFGFTVVGVFSLMAGIRVAFYPDPTDSFALAEGMQRWNISILCTAPNFFKGILQASHANELQTLRLLILGAEKTTDEFYQRIKQAIPKVKIIEGYGATECSPIVSLNRPNLPPKGVGMLIPEVEGCTIHPETHELLPVDTEGEICISGPNVFSGYLNNTVQSPFITLMGKKWYRTGDLGKIDSNNNVVLSGRLKRFIKIGGEMISLAAIENGIGNELRKKGKLTSELEGVAICADETNPAKPQLILFTTTELSKEEANELLKCSGYSRIIKIAAVYKISEIPLMGTGKIDYRRLQSTQS